MKTTGERTYESIAQELGLTKAGVMFIEKRALRKLRAALEKVSQPVAKAARLGDPLPTGTSQCEDDALASVD